MKRPLYVDLAILALLLVLVWVVIGSTRAAPSSTAGTSQVGASAEAEQSDAELQPDSTPAASSTTASTPPATPSSNTIAKNPPNKAPISTSTPQIGAGRITDPYPTAPLPFSQVNLDVRRALVNIFCFANGNELRPISGSGVIIDPRGIILTNAHVAQYVLLSEVEQISLRCTVRTGSPAQGQWIPEVMYIPPAWVKEHAAEITQARPLGTGEHDYALLYIAASGSTAPLPASFPYVSVDSREGIGFTGDSVIAASYPAEFLGASALNALSAATTITDIRQLLTFGSSSIDAISVGGVIEAQSGSSGGAIVNAWDRLIGIITTTSVGETTSQRDLRAITLSYIERDLLAQTGRGLAGMLSGDPAAQVLAFTRTQAQPLAQLLADQLQQ